MFRKFCLANAIVAMVTACVYAATPKFVEDFTTGTASFVSGAAVTHVATGGVGGAGDGFITVSRTEFPGFLGVFTAAPEFTGDLTDGCITGYSFWLQDTGADDDLEIHVGVGQAFVNFWQHVQGFSPPDGTWQEFSVNLTDESQWVQIIGTGTFQEALQASDRLLFRHDTAPYDAFPPSVIADFGLDRVKVLSELDKCPAVSATSAGVMALALLTIGAYAVTCRRPRAVAVDRRPC
jgi:hypothetical protein